MAKRAGVLGGKRAFPLVRILFILSVCFIATIFVLKFDLKRQDEQENKDSLPAFAYRSSAGVAGVVEDLVGRLTITADVLADGDLSQDSNTQSLLRAMEDSVYFVELGIYLPDGGVLHSDGTRRAANTLRLPTAEQMERMPYCVSPAEAKEIDGSIRWVSRIFVEIPGSDALLYGAVDVEKRFSTAFSPWLGDGTHSLVLFETNTGVTLFDSLHKTSTVGQNFYQSNLLSEAQLAQLRRDNAGATDAGASLPLEGGDYSFSGVNAAVSGWSLCVGLRETPLGRGEETGVSSPAPYLLLACLYTLATCAILLYRHHGEAGIRNKLRQAIARSNALLNVAVPGSDMQVFEHLTNGKIRLLSPNWAADSG